MGDIVDNAGIGLDIRPLGSGIDIIGVFPSGNFVIYNQETIPTDSTKINFATQLIYSGTVIGSLIAFNPTGGSFVKVLSYDASDNLINVGSWV